MRPNKLSPGCNLIWESSRMMLPEHRAAIEKARMQKQDIMKPELDEQERMLIDYRIRSACEMRIQISLTLYRDARLITLTGIIKKVDALTGILFLQSEKGLTEKVFLTDIVGAQEIFQSPDL